MNQAPTPPAVSREAGLTSDPEIAAKQQGPGCPRPRPPTPTAAQLSPSLGWGLHLEEKRVGEQGGECREEDENSTVQGYVPCGRHYSKAFLVSTDNALNLSVREETVFPALQLRELRQGSKGKWGALT